MEQDKVTCNKCGLDNNYYTKQLGPHKGAFCSSCHSWIKHIPQSVDHKIYFGKYKGTFLKDFTSPEQVSWLKWAHANATSLSTTMKDAIAKHLGI